MSTDNKEDMLEKYHPSHCGKYEVLRGIYPNNRRETGKPCSCGFDAAVSARDQQIALKTLRPIKNMQQVEANIALLELATLKQPQGEDKL